MAPDGQAAGELPLGNPRRWAITATVMLVSVLQVLDTSVTNVALPHIQGALSAGLDEVSWVLTSYLAANAIVLPATGWLTARLGRRRFFPLTIEPGGEESPARSHSQNSAHSS